MGLVLDVNYIKNTFSYNPINGEAVRISKGKGVRRIGVSLGSVHLCGGKTRKEKSYIRMPVKCKPVYLHRVAWVLMTGEQPPIEIDHIDGDGLNNKWENLRAGNHSENMKNQKRHKNSKFETMGITLRKDNGKYRARIMVNGATIDLGQYDTYQDAKNARLEAVRKYNFHPNHGTA